MGDTKNVNVDEERDPDNTLEFRPPLDEDKRKKTAAETVRGGGRWQPQLEEEDGGDRDDGRLLGFMSMAGWKG
nr:hypothetical protein [Tanacetum cinerariifolium]GFA39862.1 hypothetical protein [Tanacetum cinerariifolium]